MKQFNKNNSKLQQKNTNVVLFKHTFRRRVWKIMR